MDEEQGPVASGSGSGPDEQAPTFVLDPANPKGRHRKAKKSADKQEGKGYEVGSDRLAKYLNGSQNVAKRDKYEWRRRTHQDKKLSRTLADIGAANVKDAAEAAERDDLLLPEDAAGALLVPEGELEKTYKVSQADILAASGTSAAAKSFGLALDGGPFSFDYTRNGRHLALAGRTNGHLATLDWKASKPGSEVHVNETARAVRWLHDDSFFAAAQRRYVYIYDRQGAEVHQLRGHVEVTRMEFLPYHFLLATVGMPGWLKYHDTSTGQMVAELRTKLGSCDAMAQDPFNSIVHLGHRNGTVTLWSPSLAQPHVKVLAHLGPVSSLSIDPSSSGRTLATSGLDGSIKIWDMRNNFAPLASWTLRKPASSLAWSQKGLLAVGWGPHVSIYAGVGRSSSKGAYMSQLFPGSEVRQVQFCPFEDVLGVGHSGGFSSLLVPGAGEAHLDSLEADPYESRQARREREVKNLLGKLPADMIALDPDMVGTVRKPPERENPERAAIRREAAGGGGKRKGETPFRKLTRAERLEKQGRGGVEEGEEGEYQGKVAGGEEDGAGRVEREERERKRARGKNSSLKRLIRKKRKNVITPETEAIKAKIALRREQHQARKEGKATAKGALARFG